MSITARDYQEAAVQSLWDYFATKQGNPVVALPTGCHAKGSEILMFNGSIKLVENIIVGDLLMAPDSTARTVLALARGRQEMRKIIPNNGSAFEVNVDHKLSVHVTKQGKNYPSCQQREETITVRQYEESSDWYRHIRKLRRASVEFATALQTIPPYILGVLLGDGSLCNGMVNLTNPDHELLNEFKEYLVSNGLQYSTEIKVGGTIPCESVRVKDPLANGHVANRLTKMLRDLGCMEQRANSKAIPINYKIANRLQRMEILAGLLDTDSWYNSKSNYFEYCTVSSVLAKDVCFLARSLGLRASCTEKTSRYKVEGIYHDCQNHFTVNISGSLDLIPTRITRKRANTSAKQKDCLVAGFKVEKLPEADYYGFTLDADHLYLDSEFVVHHNTGKSVVQAIFLESIFRKYPAQKILCLTHVKELIEQNFAKLKTVWPGAPSGIFSAGLNKKDTRQQIIFAGIASIAKHAEKFGTVHLVIIDEAHLVSPKEESMYQLLLATLKLKNPYLKVIGMTATPWRLGQGHITEDGIFTDVCFDLTSMAAFNWLIGQGYLSPLIPKRTAMLLDTSGVHKLGGEFKANELQLAVDKDDITYAALAETLAAGADRDSWLVFASGVEHAINITAMLNNMGVDARCVHSKMAGTVRDDNIADWKAGVFKAIVNNGILTTGIDHPALDLIVMLRPTASTVLWVQMLGRGTRPLYEPGYDLSTQEGRIASMQASSKHNCIAEGQRVLTNRGLVPIEHIKLSDKLWDGVEYVSHGGTYAKGSGSVITYRGLTATPDHNVWTNGKWQAFGKVAQRASHIAKGSIFGIAVQELDSSFPLCSFAYRLAQRLCCSLFGLPKVKVGEFVKYAQQYGGLFCLFSSSASTYLDSFALHCRKAKMREYIESRLGSLWATWNYIQFCGTNRNGCLFNEVGLVRPNTTFGNGSYKQRWQLRDWKFTFGGTKNKYEQPTNVLWAKTSSFVQRFISACGIRGHNYRKIALGWVNIRTNRGSLLQPAILQTKRRLWDIHNCGPRHRFTCEGYIVSNCLVLDFAGNTARLGPINDPVIPRAKGKGTGEAPVRICDICSMYNHASARFCGGQPFPTTEGCGRAFTFTTKLKQVASSNELIKNDLPVLEVFNVDSVTYHTHNKVGKPPSLRISYFCNLRKFTEFVHFELPGWGERKAKLWWAERTTEPFPETTALAEQMATKLPIPTRIRVWVNKPYPEIMALSFNQDKTADF